MIPWKRVDSLLPMAILKHEAIRNTRRWQIFALRTAYVGLMLAAAAVGLWSLLGEGRLFWPSELARMGRTLFLWLGLGQILAAIVIVPLATASTAATETDERTIDLLLLTRLRPRQILVARLVSQGMMLLSVMGGTLPVLMLGVGLGGVAPLEVGVLVSHMLTVTVMMAATGAFFALFTSRPILATLASGLYALLFFGVLPALHIAISGDPSHLARYSPFASASATDLSALGAPLTYLPSLLVVLALAAPVYHRMLHGQELPLPFFDEWHGRAWRFAMTIPLPLAGSAICAPLSAPLARALGLLFDGWTWAVLAVGTALASWSFLQFASRGLAVLDQMDLSTLVRPLIGRIPPLPGSNPVLWRELRSSSKALLAVGLAAMATSAVFPVAMAGQEHLDVLGGLFVAGAMLMGAWFGAWSLAEERQRRTLDLLLLTTLPAWRIALGKLAGVALPLLPLAALALPLIAFIPVDGAWRWSGPRFELWTWTLPLLWLVIASAAALGRHASGRVAFGSVVATATVWLAVGALLGRDLSGGWLPWLARLAVPVWPGSSPALSVVLYAGAALLVTGGMVWRLR